jgi:hypothetical protein
MTAEEIHPAGKHHLLAPTDLRWHINEDHCFDHAAIDVPDHHVESWMNEHGVESTGDPATDRLLMWHSTTHEGENAPIALDYDGGPLPGPYDWEDEHERMCGASFVTGSSEDPYGTNCDQQVGHYPATKHEGDDPFGNGGRVRWNGGGSAAGDPLPYRDVEHVDPPSRAATYNGLPTGT